MNCCMKLTIQVKHPAVVVGQQPPHLRHADAHVERQLLDVWRCYSCSQLGRSHGWLLLVLLGGGCVASVWCECAQAAQRC